MSTYESQHITDREVERATQLQECLDNDPDDYPEGGWRAWSVVLGAWCGMLPSFGLMNTMGIFEDWLSSHQLQAYSRSEVGWISSLYVSLLFLGSVQSEYYQFMLGVGVLGGIAASMLVTPSLGCMNHWFLRRRAFATGIGTTAGGIGGVIFPIMIKGLTGKVGFAWAVRILGFLSLILCILAVSLQKTRLPRHPKRVQTIEIRALRDPSFTLTSLGIVLTDSSAAIPLVYLTSYARANEMDLSLAYQLMSILNGLSVLGRLAPGYAADKLGRFNIMILTTAMSTVLTLGLWVSCAQSQAAIVSYAALFGLSSGSAISLTPVCVAQITRTEDFGKRFGTTYTMVGLGVLVSIPIAGRLVEVQPSDGVGGYRALILFCGLMQAVAFLCFVLARGLRTQWRVRVVY
ncbi:predicted protein [Aspergillus terreus NIH2624]|uniref:Major facilitator superfamily (MFS) profile domain-containing protein n=1 Tax=Aspergillus terreus (strain NIH 2624 / FGSC A1156) TaxID=341663 RepID=Q0C8F2_ASPTN|nr:uncharacterized protein ATEG_10032 [Aspergillus terreus NIH2624]EAU29481.1 predicted protein [Aspergillus terreus NIH2624]